jgi:hypothetical protein
MSAMSADRFTVILMSIPFSPSAKNLFIGGFPIPSDFLNDFTDHDFDLVRIDSDLVARLKALLKH